MTVADLPRRTARSALWRDVHKGIRSALGMLVLETGAVDPEDRDAVEEVVELVHAVVDLLDSHARAEDEVTAPVVAEHLPDLAALVAADHEEFGPQTAALAAAADAVLDAADRRAALHDLHLRLSAFTGQYLLHQDLEERVVLPALEDAVGLPEVRRLEGAFIASIPEDERLDGMVMMFPAMNVVERTEVLSMIQDHAPAEWFAQVWEVVTEVLDPDDVAELERRLGGV